MPESGENGTDLCQKRLILAREKSPVPELPRFRATFQKSVPETQVFRAIGKNGFVKEWETREIREKGVSHTVASRELVRQVPDLRDTPNPESDRKKGFYEREAGAFVPPSVSAGEEEN